MSLGMSTERLICIGKHRRNDQRSVTLRRVISVYIIKRPRMQGNTSRYMTTALNLP